MIIIVGLIAWDNYRIKVTELEVVIESLPDEFNGFKILQISDLHEREFGKDQKRLLKKINTIDYDVLVSTGDMLENRKSTNYQPFYTVLEGIDKEKEVIVVSGNDDPPSYEFSSGFGKSEYIKGIESRDAHFLESIKTIEENDEQLHFVNLELAIIKDPEHIGKVNGSFQEPYAENIQYNEYQTALWEEMIHSDVLDSDEVIIALNHYPIPDIRMEYIKTDPVTKWHNFDLVIAGHYHGGQIRIPFYGALFIPDPWYEPNSLFPPQDRVRGLWDNDGTKQYVSAGLGSSGAIPFLKIRLFSPPEINVITLKNK